MHSDLHVRLPQGLSQQLDHEASRSNRSKNTVIQRLLAEALTPSPTGAEVLERLTSLETTLAALTSQVQQLAQAVAHLQATAASTLEVVSALDRRQGIQAARQLPHHRR